MRTSTTLLMSLLAAFLLTSANVAEAGKDKKKDDQAELMSGMQTGGGQSGKNQSQQNSGSQPANQQKQKGKAKSKCKDARGKQTEC